MSRFSAIFPRPLPAAASMFARERMLVFESVSRDYFVADRLPMRIAGLAAKRNLRHRYQVLSADQSECYLCRSKSAAIARCKMLAEMAACSRELREYIATSLSA